VRCLAVVATLLAGCSFTPNDLGDSPGGGHGGPTETGPDAAPRATGCPSDLALALCFDFEDASLMPTVLDGSPRGHDATSANVSVMPRIHEQAASVSVATSSQIYIPPSFDLSSFFSLTQEAWVRPDVTGNGAWAINHQPQYGLAYDGETALCQIGDQTASVAFHTAPGTWTHLACVYDTNQIKLFINGSVAACAQPPSKIDTRTYGTYIGPQLTGGIDNVRIYDDHLDAQEICDHAGATNCTASCSG
jgi:hypothetical protein